MPRALPQTGGGGGEDAILALALSAGWGVSGGLPLSSSRTGARIDRGNFGRGAQLVCKWAPKAQSVSSMEARTPRKSLAYFFDLYSGANCQKQSRHHDRHTFRLGHSPGHQKSNLGRHG